VESEHPVWCEDSSAFSCHPTLPGMLDPTLIRDQVGEVREPRQKRLRTTPWMMDPVHDEQGPRDGIMRLLHARAGP
jgi:hypothetical protein